VQQKRIALDGEATKSLADDAPIANVKQEKCRTRFKVGRVDKEREARPPARFSDSLYPRSYVDWFRLWRIVEARHLVFKPRHPPDIIYHVVHRPETKPNNTQAIDRIRDRICLHKSVRMVVLDNLKDNDEFFLAEEENVTRITARYRIIESSGF